MSTTEQKETELVAGIIGGITQKKADTWTVAVSVEGLQNPKNLWTKDSKLIDSLRNKFGEHGAFVCNASYWQHPQHGQVRSLWIDDVSEDGSDYDGQQPEEATQRVATPAPAAKAATNSGGDGMTKDEWARKDSAIHKMACIKTAADALKHTVPSEPTTGQLNEFVTRTMFIAIQWHRSVLAERDDPAGENIPF